MDFTPDFLAEFDRLYDRLLRERFEPALRNLNEALNGVLDKRFAGSQRLRLRVETGRIKSANRLLIKAQTEKYQEGITKPDDVFELIRDVVGTRITCNTLSDVDAVLDAIVKTATGRKRNRSLHKLRKDWIDNYITRPKESGYRAINILVGVPVLVGDELVPVSCEVQVRTLLQNAWGELTHEDTFKPGVRVPPLVGVLSKRLATTLAALDEIAQDLRNELDKTEALHTPAQGDVQVAPPEHEEPAVPAPDEAALTWEEVVTAFAGIFPGSQELPHAKRDDILKHVRAADVDSVEELQAALLETDPIIRDIEAKYNPIVRTPYGRILSALDLHQDPEGGRARLYTSLSDSKARWEEDKAFPEKYPVGRQTVGTVVHVNRNYALVQLPEGDTGIVHVTAMKERPDEFISVADLVHQGDSVRVEVLKTLPRENRIELKLIRSPKEE